MDGDALDPGAYRVLARKHRPQTFDALVGQDALVRVLSNAFERGRVPHAMILTGVRGVGKTTTARIIAKGLNCEASDRPTRAPCGVCDNCVAIAESRHTDVLEMDAASRTGIDDIREIIDSVRYRAARGRYKVYIVDETHMLSKNAFNGLLKTLEEPPPHVVFILATTDIHKVPVTVLSRCMRFDLRRVEPGKMAEHLGRIADVESIVLEPEALSLLARASEGSVRDGLSLLDQASAHGGETVSAASVREMLGLADRTRLFDLFEAIMVGRTPEALDILQSLYRDGGDPLSLMKELAEACHLSTMARAAPTRLEDPALAPAERERAADLGGRLSMRALTRAWQLLLKAVEEVGLAPTPIAAAEMAVIRMAHIADLPSPEEAVRRLVGGDAAAPSAPGPGPAGGGAGPQSRLAVAASAPQPESDPAPAPSPATRAEARPSDEPASFSELIDRLRLWREAKLRFDVEQFVRPGPIGAGRFEFTPVDGAPSDLASRLGAVLSRRCGARWIVSIADGHSGATVAETQAEAAAGLRSEALSDDGVRAAMAAFPSAVLADARDMSVAPAAAIVDDGDDALFESPEIDDDAEAAFLATAGYEPAYLYDDDDDDDDL